MPPPTTICEICGDSPMGFRWTDHHGIGACLDCGAPYQLYFYEGQEGHQKRVQRSPELMLLPEWVPLLRKYWEENHRNVDPGAYNFPGSSYEVATSDDFRIYKEWMESHESEQPE